MSREITYNMQRGMIDYFMNLLNKPRKEIWLVIKDACFKCVDKLDNNSKSKSWCYAQIPDSEIKLRIDVNRSRWYYNRHTKQHEEKESYFCDIKFSNISDHERFTESQVEEYIIEEILLGNNNAETQDKLHS